MFWVALRHNLFLLVSLPVIIVTLSLFFSAMLNYRGGVPGAPIYKVVYFFPRRAVDRGLARFEFPGSRILYYVFVAGMVFPGFLALVPLFFVVQNLGLMNSYLGLVLVYATHGMSFSVFFLTAFFKTQSKEQAEAALVDGRSHWGVLFRIMLPLARPGLSASGSSSSWACGTNTCFPWY